jgi:hypothetical protein
VAAVRLGVAEAADAIAGLHRGIEDAEGLARAHGFAIAAGGTVTDVAPPVVPEDQVEQVQRERTAVQTEIVDRIEQVLRRAVEVDTALADVLRRAAAEQIDDGTGATLAGAAQAGALAGDLPSTAPPGDAAWWEELWRDDATAADNAGWWAALSDAERARIVPEHPEWVGNLDGIPAEVRHDANMSRLAAETARVNSELGAARIELANAIAAEKAWPDGLPGVGASRVAEAQARVDNLVVQREALAAVNGTVGPGLQLLLLDVNRDRPRVAVAVGDVDTADHVAVLTPGMDSDVPTDIKRYTEDMRGVHDVAARELAFARRGDETVATVTWIGYQPLRVDASDLTNPMRSPVLTDRPATEGGADLARFSEGINASRASDPHLTALGHSYGSTTTGYTLQEATGVDDAVLFGSPGASTGDVADLGVPGGHVAVIEAREEVVGDLGRFGGDANHADGVTNLSSSPHRLVDRPDLTPEEATLRESTGHSAYLTPGTTSQHNIAATVAGLHDARIEGNNNDTGDTIRRLF